MKASKRGIMDNIRSVIKILFRYASPVEVLEGHAHYDNIQKRSFSVLANTYMPNYSNNEIENMLDFLASEFEWHNNKQRGRKPSGGEKKVNVFDAVLLFADSVLVEENNTPQCRYEHLLRWREMIVALDEDLFITSFLAQRDLLYPHAQRRFFWPPVIGHNNKELNRLMAQGVAENHFHLKGSSPTFQLSWMSMMNDVRNPMFRKIFMDYEQRRLSIQANYNTQYTKPSLYIMYLQAALIRLYLFCSIQNEFFSLRRMEVEEEKKKAVMQRDVQYLLAHTDELIFYLPCIQEVIEFVRETYAQGEPDYLICRSFLRVNPDHHLNELLCGERWLMYEFYKKAYSDDIEFKAFFGDWFYAYLLIKEEIRAELVQVNGNVGFDNFLLYQNRKESFIDGTAFEIPYLRMAVKDTILNQHIKKLEARIVPKDTSDKIKKAIQKYDKGILSLEPEEDKEALRDKFFYVFHFIKEKDAALNDKILGDIECRHYAKRSQVRRQAQAIFHFREVGGELAERVRGIDAASQEIGCRPEVFAQAFRFLKNQTACYKDFKNGKTVEIADLCITYHVGEDFLDVLDGLRAIDEAVSFLNMKCNDRLGHALALGVDVEAWYEAKSKRILISQLDYLDNLVWLYEKIRKYHIEGCEDAIKYIEKRYDEYFRIVYLNNIRGGYVEKVFSEAAEYCRKRNIPSNYSNTQRYYSINTYYDSWKLRGDNPENFRKGYFEMDSCLKSEWDEYGVNKEFPENYQIRYNPEAAFLYHTYHYNFEVKQEGEKKKEIKVNPCIIQAVKKVQRKMQWIIGQKGIGIETNPSSNALIGTFKRYDHHPILNWYNLGLATSTEEIQSVAQIQVSINTDDQGVFATYIENEYAYLALALEKMKDENGNPRYSRTLIYQWLDNVRKMGLVQCFEEC